MKPRMRGMLIPGIRTLTLFLCVAPRLAGQTGSAQISGMVTDPQGALVPNATVTLVNKVQGITRTAQTNSSGLYTAPFLPVGAYRITVQATGFQASVTDDVEVHVGDLANINFTLKVGSATETVTVEGGAPVMNTQDATVSTIVDRQFVANMPLNGRSFQTLVALTPGVVVTAATFTEQGQFSVNGQRADANYFSVDGVSANVGAINSAALVQGAGGLLPSLSVLGGTQSLASVDAMQEFRVQTSSFAPEFGRTPGGQISIVTRSGTNQFHGMLFEYLRNDVLDANNWFANYQGLPKPKDRQSDFGGIVGGPIVKDRTFFFFSYEGLRLRQPLAQATLVPSTTARQSAPAQIRPFLNAFPLPNGPDLGNGLAQFNASYSDPGTVDAYSLRMDHTIGSKFALFGRWSYSPSDSGQRSGPPGGGVLSNNYTYSAATQTLTVGLTESFSPKISNETRLNYSNGRAGVSRHLDSFGGAVPLPDSLMFPAGFSSANDSFGFSITGVGVFSAGRLAIGEQRQVNAVDNLSIAVGSHQMKFGVDYRWLAPFTSPAFYVQSVTFSGMAGPSGALSGVAQFAGVVAEQGAALLIHNFCAYGQDTWKVMPRLTLTYGMRWDINPALKGKNSSNDPFTVLGLDNPATMTLAPRGTPLYKTTYGNVAPRIGVAYKLRRRQSWESVLRGGFGIFYDLGSGSTGRVTGGFPFAASNTLLSVPFPLTPQQAAPPVISLNPPVSSLAVTDPKLTLPRAYQWNAAFEQSLGSNQTASLTYVGAVGRDLLRGTILLPPATFAGTVWVYMNTATSDYHAMQFTFRRRLSRNLQALASYSWAHSIDIASNDSGNFNVASVVKSPNVDRGNSDFDVRHSFTGAVSYDLPAPQKHRVVRAVLEDWSLDSFIMARSAPPVSLLGPFFVVSNTRFQARPNVIPGIPFYLYGPQYPGGKIINNTLPTAAQVVAAGCVAQTATNAKGAFCTPPTGTQGNFGRNILRAFGAWQTDLAMRRQFHVTEGLGLQFRAEFFNLFNHPNFGPPTNSISSALFGQSTQTLASSLTGGTGNGGFNSLYQVGGPRSIQLALKLLF